MGLAQSLVTHLIDLLNRECAQLKPLAQLGEEERTALKTLAIDRLAQINARRAQLVDAMAELEKERINVVAQLAKVWGLSSGEMTVSLVADRVGATDGVILLRQHQRLADMTAVLRKTMMVNQQAIAGFIEFTRKALGAWQQPSHADGLYAASGAWQETHAGGDFIVHKG